VDRAMERKPYYIINGHKTKDAGKKVSNVVSCGCAHDHDEENWNCEYNLFHTLVTDLGVERSQQGIFHCTNKGGYGWSNRGQQKTETIGKSIQRINKRIQFAPKKKCTGAMGRKTFITLSRKFFGFEDEKIKDESHHADHNAYMRYVDGGYMNVDSQTLISRTFQEFEQRRYLPPRPESFPRRVRNVEHNLGQLTESVDMLIKLLITFLKQLKKLQSFTVL